jgi:biopolymer transport protein ExbD
MQIRFRCRHCAQLQSISEEMAGTLVACAMCGEETPVPFADEFRPKQVIAPAATGDLKPTVPTIAAGRPSRPEAVDHDDDERTFLLRRPRAEFDDMDLTPMVDVTFLLLIFFMVTASFSLQKTLAFPPPNPDDQGARQSIQTLDDFKKDSLMVEIDERNAIYIDDERVGDPAALVSTLREKSRLEQKFEVVIDAHANALHETVVAVVDAANEIGMRKIRLTTLRGD